MELLKELIMQTMDRGPSKKISPIALSETISDWNLLLADNRYVTISSLVSKGPLLLIFIRGTWCPFCRMHMGRLRKWVSGLNKTNATIIVVSSETTSNIRKWKEANNFHYLFASDSKLELSDIFGVRLGTNDYSQAATFLIDSNLTVRLAYRGKRTKENFTAMEKAIEENT